MAERPCHEFLGYLIPSECDGEVAAGGEAEAEVEADAEAEAEAKGEVKAEAEAEGRVEAEAPSTSPKRARFDWPTQAKEKIVRL